MVGLPSNLSLSSTEQQSLDRSDSSRGSSAGGGLRSSIVQSFALGKSSADASATAQESQGPSVWILAGVGAVVVLGVFWAIRRGKA
jgi:hypothetical protein